MTGAWLSIHADYSCRHSGACCTAGWPIPVEDSAVAPIEAAIARGALVPRGPAFATAAEVFHGAGTVLGTNAEGACVFYEAASATRRCAVHRALGHAALPSSCRHFPRIGLRDARGDFVTLSHYCPTAAAMLFRDDRPLAVVAGPSSVAGEEPEGLDAREALPPLLRPSILMDHEGYGAWERLVVSLFGDEDVSAEGALARVAAAAERLRAWRPGGVPLSGAIEALRGEIRDVPDTGSGHLPPDVALFEEARDCVPAPWSWEPAPDAGASVWDRRAAGSWASLARPTRSYLASRAFASWVAYQGDGLRTIVRSLEAALSVVKIEALRIAERSGVDIEAGSLLEAFRRADLLLLHFADREALARVWSRAETPAARS